MKGRLLAFDPGLKRIGVATGNQTTGTTQALPTLIAKNGEPNWKVIIQLIDEWKPQTLVVGFPMHLDGSESVMSKKSRRFANQLETKTKLPVVLVDERLTSAGADALIRDSAESGKSQTRRRQEWRDSLAAELILGTYINENPDPS